VSRSLSSGLQETTDFRLRLDADGGWMLLHSWGLGIGPGNFPDAMQAWATRIPFTTGGVLSPHNFFVEVAAEYGLIVLGAVVWYLWRLAREITRLPSSWRTSLWASMAALVVASTAISGYLIASTLWLFFGTYLALIAAYASVAEEEKDARPYTARRVEHG
jgi:hypothetical protein